MNRFFVLIIAGLCLATLVSCNGSGGPVFPDNWGLELRNLPSELVVNQPIVIEWKVYDKLLNKFVISQFNGVDWEIIGTTASTSLEWKASDSMFQIRVEGFNADYSENPLAIATSKNLSVAPFGDISDYSIVTPIEFRSGIPSEIIITARDKWNNIVKIDQNIMMDWSINRFDVFSSPTSSTIALKAGQGTLFLVLIKMGADPIEGDILFNISGSVTTSQMVPFVIS